MRFQEAPTINEILLNRKKRKPDSSYTKRPNLYQVGDNVVFVFSGLRKTGRITNAFCINGMCMYHIETPTHTWYQDIDQQSIIQRV